MNKKALKILSLGLVLCMLMLVGAGCKKAGADTSAVESDVSEDLLDLPDYEGGDTETTGSGGGAGTSATGSKIQNGSTTGGSTQAGTSANPYANMPKELKGSTVIVATWGDESSSEYQKVTNLFRKELGITVRFVQYAQHEYVSKVQQTIAAGSGPDVIIMAGTLPTSYEIVQQLPSYFNLNDGFWDKRVTQAFSVTGKNYFVNSYVGPFTGGTVCYYNKKIFQDNGLVTPQDYYNQGKWSYENLEKCMQNVNKLGMRGGIIDPTCIMSQMGKPLIDYNPSTGTYSTNVTDPQVIEAFEYHTRLVEQGLTGNFGTTAFASGQVGICVDSYWGLKYNGWFKDMSPADIGVVPLPTSLNGKELKYYQGGFRGYGVAQGSKNPQGAYYFLRYFLDYSNYSRAGASIWANKVLEKYWAETQIPLYKKSNIVFDYSGVPLEMVNAAYTNSDWTAVRHSAPGQVAVELSKMKNVCDAATVAAAEKLKTLAK